MDFECLYPNPFDINMVTRKATFFLGDRRVIVGEIKLCQDKNCLAVQVPDIEHFLISREYLDDGTFDWLEWGPRLN